MFRKIKNAWDAFDRACSGRRGRFVITAASVALACFCCKGLGHDDLLEDIYSSDNFNINYNGKTKQYQCVNKTEE